MFADCSIAVVADNKVKLPIIEDGSRLPASVIFGYIQIRENSRITHLDQQDIVRMMVEKGARSGVLRKQ
jgi:hypothetical protein